MSKVSLLIILLGSNIFLSFSDEIKLSLGPDRGGQEAENLSFVATDEWQEIKPGQKVPQGLHYRMNLQTGKKEAKLLDPNQDSKNITPDNPTSLQATKSETEKIDETAEVENSRKRLKEALKNIPSEKFDDVTEEKWKEISKKYRTYEKIKEELKDVDLNPKTEAEVIKQLFDEFFDEKIDSARRLDILKDLEFLMHSIDNSLLFISSGGLEKLLIPNLVNQTDVNVRVTLLKIFGAMTQNNEKAKAYVSDKSNLANDLINLLAKSENIEELSASLYAIGSFMRDNKILSQEILKKSLIVLLEILIKSTVNISIKSKDLILISDLINQENFDENFIKHQKICEQIATFLEQHRNALIIDTDAAEKCGASLLELQICNNKWSELPMLRHSLLVVLNNYKVRLNEESDEDIRFMFSLVIEHLENLNKQLYGDLKISTDDLSQRYQGSVERDEL